MFTNMLESATLSYTATHWPTFEPLVRMQKINKYIYIYIYIYILRIYVKSRYEMVETGMLSWRVAWTVSYAGSWRRNEVVQTERHVRWLITYWVQTPSLWLITMTHHYDSLRTGYKPHHYDSSLWLITMTHYVLGTNQRAPRLAF